MPATFGLADSIRKNSSGACAPLPWPRPKWPAARASGGVVNTHPGAITAIKAATANPKSDAALLDEARQLHRKSQFMWDFVSAENSMGFHNPEYILKILAESTNKARQAQMLAAVVQLGAGHFERVEVDAVQAGGLSPFYFHMVNIREHDSWVHTDRKEATDKAKELARAAVARVAHHKAQDVKKVPVHPDVLVVGGGIAGIHAAMTLANAGKRVFLVEREPSIGGHMAKFDKTFPTLDCAACILTPKMVAVGKHPNIDLMVLSEVQEVSGGPGAYRVKVLKHASRVDASACVACNDCAQFCPVTVPSEWDQGIATRKAIYIPFPQAVPNAYVVDPAACTWVQSGGKKCGACVKKCAKEAVHLDAKDEVVELTVGNIVVATGYKPFDPQPMGRYGYRTYPNVLTALEFERLTNASGPTGGKIVLRTKRPNKKTKTDEWVFEAEGPKPRSVAIIHCVGSRDRNHNPYCSRVCCMYSLKFAHLVKEKLPGSEVHEYFIDMRAYGKGYEEFLERIGEEGVHVVRGRSAEVVERAGQLLVRGEDVLADRLVETPVDMVLLAVGLLAGGLLLAAGPAVQAHFENAELTRNLPWVAAFTGLTLAGAPLDVALNATGRIGWAALVRAGTEGLRAAGMIAGARLTGTVEGVFAGIVAATAIRAVVTLAVLVPRHGLRVDSAALRRQVAYALPFGLAFLLIVPQQQWHLYAVGAAVSAAAFAVYSVGTFQLPVVDVLYTPVSELLQIGLAEQEGARRPARAGLALFHEAVLQLSFAFVPLAGLLAVVAPELIALLFSPRYVQAVPIFRVAVLSVVLAALPLDGVMRARAQNRFMLALSTAKLGGTVALVWTGLAVLGPVGALAGWVAVALEGQVFGQGQRGARRHQAFHRGIVRQVEEHGHA